MAKRPLSAMEEAFCAAYVTDIRRNATQAAISAGYSERSAYNQGSRLLEREWVKERIRELVRETIHAAAEDPKQLAVHIYRALINTAMSDITDVVQIVHPGEDLYEAAKDAQVAEENGQMFLDLDAPVLYVKGTRDLSPDVTSAIKSIRKTKDGLQIEMHGRDTALRILSEATGIIKGSGVEVNISVADKINEARARLAERTS